MTLEVDIGGLKLKNPVIAASGTFGYGLDYKDAVDLDKLGGIVVKGLSLYPSTGNPEPRVVETPCGLLNAVGLENIGINRFVSDKLPLLKEVDTNIFMNIYGGRAEEYAGLASIADGLDGICGIEVNISCPNVEKGGAAFGTDPEQAYQVVRKVRQATGKHVMVKLSPNVTDIAKIAVSAEKAGADSVSLINTLTGLAVDADTGRPVLANVTGGLSGPAVKPVALRMVYETAQAVSIPVIGVGGIMTARDAAEFMIAGASAVQVGTATLTDPGSMIRIIQGLEKFKRKKRISRISDIRGSLKV
ncbi:MAG: dihydroorotate dehydrogenase [Desulfobacteraceae bacterium]